MSRGLDSGIRSIDLSAHTGALSESQLLSAARGEGDFVLIEASDRVSFPTVMGPPVCQGVGTGTDPATHISAVQAVLDAGATPFMHFGQRNPAAAIDFYRTQVLPKLH